MTDRDFFAAAALAGYNANPALPDHIKDNIAFNAFADADAMIDERPKDLPQSKPTLTDEEREAVETAAYVAEWFDSPNAATLRGLLERFK